MLFCGLLILSVKIIFGNFTMKLSKYNFTLFKDKTTFVSFSPCGTSILGIARAV
jgi:hypothetical protein